MLTLSKKYFHRQDFPLVVTGDTKEDQSSIEKHIKDNPSGTIIITKLANVLD